MATIYGAEIGIDQTTLIGTLLMVQFVGIPFAFLFGWLAKKIGTKKSIYLSLLVYTCIAIFAYFMQGSLAILGAWICRGNRSGRQSGLKPVTLRPNDAQE